MTDTKALPKGHWYIIGIVQQEPGRWRAWVGPKGSCEMDRLDAPTEAEVTRLAQGRCNERNHPALYAAEFESDEAHYSTD